MSRQNRHRRAARTGVMTLVVAATVACVSGGGFVLAGLDRPSADASAGAAPTGVRITLTTTAAVAAVALATDVDTRLGLPAPASLSAERLTDAGTGRVVDVVTDLDGDGTPVAISRFDLGGQLVSSVRLGLRSGVGTRVTSGFALSHAATIAASAGIPTSGAASVTTRAAGGWLVRWVRTVGGVAVPGDGVGVQLDADGSFHAIVRTEHPLAPAPSAQIDQARARILARARLDMWLSADLRADATISSITLAWVAPNDTFGDPLPTASPGVLRLAWIVRVTTGGSLADRVAGLEIAFDAGNGTRLGGDVLE